MEIPTTGYRINGCVYNDKTLEVLAEVLAWTQEGIRPDIPAEEKLKHIKEQLIKIIP